MGLLLKRVVSINASGHKFGLVYPGAGWHVPAYSMPPNLEHVDVVRHTKRLMAHPFPLPQVEAALTFND